MATTITVAIEKGGCGKTTTVLNLADLAGNEARVLCIDTDPQGNLTYSLEGTRITDEEFIGHALYDLYNDFEKVHAGEKSVRDYVVETNLDNVDLIPASLETPKINTKAKELIESCCKTILDNKGVTWDKNWDMSKLTGETLKLLNLTPKNIPDSDPVSENIKAVLGNLRGITTKLAEIRNPYGSGHGKSASFTGLETRHAKLAVGCSITFVTFLWDTYEGGLTN